MNLSKEFLSLQFSKLAAMYSDLGMRSEAKLAGQHASDVRKLDSPRVVYIKHVNREGYYFEHSKGGGRFGPFFERQEAMNKAWAIMPNLYADGAIAVVDGP